MKAIVVRWLVILAVLAFGYLLFLRRYQVEARIWHWRHGYSTRAGNYEFPVPEHWLIIEKDFVGFTMLNTAPNLARDHKFHTTSVVTFFPFRNRPIGPAGLATWRALQHQRLEKEGVKSVEEKKVTFSGEELTCIGGNELQMIFSRIRNRPPGMDDANILSLDCLSTSNLEVMFVGEPSDLQPFYVLVSQIR